MKRNIILTKKQILLKKRILNKLPIILIYFRKIIIKNNNLIHYFLAVYKFSYYIYKIFVSKNQLLNISIQNYKIKKLKLQEKRFFKKLTFLKVQKLIFFFFNLKRLAIIENKNIFISLNFQSDKIIPTILKKNFHFLINYKLFLYNFFSKIFFVIYKNIKKNKHITTFSKSINSLKKNLYIENFSKLLVKVLKKKVNLKNFSLSFELDLLYTKILKSFNKFKKLNFFQLFMDEIKWLKNTIKRQKNRKYIYFFKKNNKKNYIISQKVKKKSFFYREQFIKKNFYYTYYSTKKICKIPLIYGWRNYVFYRMLYDVKLFYKIFFFRLIFEHRRKLNIFWLRRSSITRYFKNLYKYNFLFVLLKNKKNRRWSILKFRSTQVFLKKKQDIRLKHLRFNRIVYNRNSKQKVFYFKQRIIKLFYLFRYMFLLFYGDLSKIHFCKALKSVGGFNSFKYSPLRKINHFFLYFEQRVNTSIYRLFNLTSIKIADLLILERCVKLNGDILRKRLQKFSLHDIFSLRFDVCINYASYIRLFSMHIFRKWMYTFYFIVNYSILSGLYYRQPIFCFLDFPRFFGFKKKWLKLFISFIL